MKSLLDRPPDTALVWLDAASPEYEAQLAELDRMPLSVTMVSIAARCDDWNVVGGESEGGAGRAASVLGIQQFCGG